MELSLALDKYNEFVEEENIYSHESKELYFKFIISLNNSVYDAYISLMELYFKNNEFNKGIDIIKVGYNTLLKNEFNNKFPKKLNYYEIGNRSIYRLIYNYADMLWIIDEKDKAMDIFKKLLKINPSGINEVVWLGKVVEQTALLCSNANKNGNSRIIVSKKVFNDLSEHNKSILNINNSHNCYHGNVIMKDMNKWVEANRK